MTKSDEKSDEGLTDRVVGCGTEEGSTRMRIKIAKTLNMMFTNSLSLPFCSLRAFFVDFAFGVCGIVPACDLCKNVAAVLEFRT